MVKSFLPNLIRKLSFPWPRLIQGNAGKKIFQRDLHVPGIYGFLSKLFYLYLICQGKFISMLFQNIQADGVKGTDLKLPECFFISQLFFQTASHLLGRFVCKSYCCDLRRLHFPSLYKVKDLFDQSLGLSCSRSCDNRRDRADALHCLSLLLI